MGPVLFPTWCGTHHPVHSLVNAIYIALDLTIHPSMTPHNFKLHQKITGSWSFKTFPRDNCCHEIRDAQQKF